MNKKELMSRMQGSLGKMGFQIKKHSPEILLAAGIVGGVISAVMACKATTKLSTILAKSSDELDAIHDCEKNETLAEDYTKDDAKKDLAIVYAKTGVAIAKLYAPAVVLGTLSITSVLASHNILHKRNVAMAAAYATVDKAFKDYRARVVERFGEAVDHELRYDIKAKKFEETVTDEKGKEKTVKNKVSVSGIDGYSDYARFFDEYNRYWEKDAEYNKMFLRREQAYANDILKSRGHLFLNEVYERLGFPLTKAGQVVGWKYNPDNPTGDNYVDFGMYDTNREAARDFINGYERAILLDFNVDGPILSAFEEI